jgi:hypothetical protein
MATSVPLYASLMTQFERRRERLGWTFATLEAEAGIGDGQYAKLLHVDASSGRRGNWPILQVLADTLFAPGAYELRFVVHGPGLVLATASRSEKNTRIPKNMRVVLAGMASDGGKARAAKLTADRRKEIARLGAEARWRYARLPPVSENGMARYSGSSRLGEATQRPPQPVLEQNRNKP